MTYRIVADSASNVYSLPGSVDYRSVPLKVLVDEREFSDDQALNHEEFAEALSHGQKTSTSCANSFEWKQAFEGADHIFAVTVSSSLSGSFSAASQAAREYMEEHPGSMVYVFDSLTAAGEMQLLIEKLAGLIEQGMDFTDIIPAINDYQKHTHVVFYVESLRNLARNGRVSQTIARLAGLLSIRFVGFGTAEGTIAQAGIARGTRKALASMLEEMIRHGYAGGKVLISHSLNLEAAEAMKKRILEAFPSAEGLIRVLPSGAICTYYTERGGLIIGYEGGTGK